MYLNEFTCFEKFILMKKNLHFLFLNYKKLQAKFKKTKKKRFQEFRITLNKKETSNYISVTLKRLLTLTSFKIPNSNCFIS